MQVIQANVAQAPQYQQQPTYWDRLLARLATLGQLGTQGWQAWQYGQQVDNQRAQIKQSVLHDVMSGNYSQPEAYNILVDVAGFDPEAARRLSSATKIKQAGVQLDSLQQRDAGSGGGVPGPLGTNNEMKDPNYLNPETFYRADTEPNYMMLPTWYEPLQGTPFGRRYT